MSRRPFRGIRLTLVAVTACVIAALWALALIRMEVDKRSTVAAVERENDNLALTLGEQNSRALRDVKERLLALARVVAESGSLDEKALSGFDRRIVTMVITSDAEGRVTSADGKHVPGRTVADREYFAFLREHRTTAPYVGSQTVGRMTGEPIIPVSVRVEGPDGRFAGVVAAALKPSYFDGLYGKPQLGDDGVVLLLGTDGFVRAARATAHPLPEDLRNATLLRLQRSRPVGHFLSRGLHGVPRFLSYYTLPEYPSLMVVVGRSRDEALADYRDRTRVVIGVTAIASVVVLSLAALIAVFQRRQRQHLEALRDSEARYRKAAGELGLVLDGSVDMICSFDSEGRYVHVSAGSDLVLGFRPEELEGRHWDELVHPEDLDRSHEAFQQVLAGRPVRAFMNRSRCRDGSYAHTMWSARWLESEQTMFCVARDVTENKLLEAANQVLESRLAETLELLGAGFCIVDPSFRITYVNRAAESMGRLSRDASLGRLVWDVVPISGSPFETEFRRAMRSRTPGRVCAYLDAFEGWFEVHTYPGTDGGIILYIDDVTEREIARQRLAESEQRFHHAALATSDAIWDWACDSDRISWSEGFAALFGHDAHGPASTLEGWKALIHPDDREGVIASFNVAFAQGSSRWSGEYRFRRADGSYATVRDYASVVRGPDGRPTRMVGALSDITEHRELERQLMRTQRLESVGTLASGIAHDLNNVFTPIVMGLNLVGTDRLDPEQRAILDTVRTSAQRGAQLVKQVLSFARGHAGNLVPVQPAEIVDELERMMRETFPRNIAIAVRMARDLPEIRADATQVHQVLLNLCLNARDAMPDRGGTIDVRADVAALAAPVRSVAGDMPAGRYVRIRVADDGTGMDEKVIERLFEPFFTTKPVGSGTGLGLPTALSIVRKHGGGMQVRSAPGRGSCFTVWLPVVERVAGASVVEPERHAARGHGERVLVVDDEPAVRDMACRALLAAGYAAESAADGPRALDVLRFREFDVIFTDLMMPVMDGATLIREALRLAPSLRVVCASGIAADAATLPAGAVFLPKPYTAEALASAVAEALLQLQPA